MLIDPPAAPPLNYLNSRHIRFIKVLEKIAVDVTPIRSARIAAGIVIDNQLVSFGVNMKRSHPFQQRFARNDDAIYWHAEIHSIFNALKRVKPIDLTKASLYVVRVKYSGSRIEDKHFIWGLCHPCPGCLRCIYTYNIRNVIYTTNEQNYTSLY